jgi:hypothetical protein
LLEVKELLLTSTADLAIKQEDDLPGISLAVCTGLPARHAPAIPPSSSSLTGHIGSDGFPIDSLGHRWCNPTSANCHRCGRSGHIAHKCMHVMPTFVRDWILSNSRSAYSQSTAFATAIEWGFDVDTFILMWAAHTGKRHGDFSGLSAGRGPLRT